MTRAALLALCGCRAILGLDEPAAIDAAVTAQVSGTVYDVGNNNAGLSGVAVTWQDSTGATATATTDAQGKFTLHVVRIGAANDGFLHAQLTGKYDSDLYLAAPFAGDVFDASIPMLSPDVLAALGQAVNVTQTQGDGWIGAFAVGTANLGLAGIVVTTLPQGVVRYDVNGTPSPTATATDTDGVAYIFDLPPGLVSVGAQPSGGLKFAPRIVNARPDHITITTIVGE